MLQWWERWRTTAMREEWGAFSPHRRLAKANPCKARTSRLLLTPSLRGERFKWYNANVVTD